MSGLVHMRSFCKTFISGAKVKKNGKSTNLLVFEAIKLKSLYRIAKSAKVAYTRKRKP